MTSSILFGLLILQSLYQLSECLYSVKICELKPCRNSGKCIDASDGTFRCECTELYSGILCEKRVRPCDSQPCKNGGNCSENGVHCFKCECPIGFKGNDCSEKIGVCEGNPCRNSGECIDGKNGTFQCKCTKLYSGIFCEQRVRPCDSQPCKNGGNCSDDGADCFKCKCSSGFKGSDCSEKVLPCEVSPCKHGGICSNENGVNFKCSCQHGYMGKNCEERVLPCDVSPCKHGGICSKWNGVNFTCSCQHGYIGKKCEERDVLALSKILMNNTNYIAQLRQWVGNQTKWKLCYRASEHGWRSRDFHSRCDFKGPTLSIISCGEYIFGGYTDASWGGPIVFKTSKKSFLFSLRNKYNLQPYKADIYRYYTKAICNAPDLGITFGGGPDIRIDDNADVSSGSYSNFGNTYKLPPGYSHRSDKASSFFAGSYHFYPSQVEVYYQV